MSFMTDFAKELGELRDLARSVIFPDTSTAFDRRSTKAQMALFKAVEGFVTSCQQRPLSFITLKARQDYVLESWAELNDTVPAQVQERFFYWIPGGLEYQLKLADIGDKVLGLLLMNDDAEHAGNVPSIVRLKLREFEMSSYSRPQSPPERVLQNSTIRTKSNQ